MDLLAELLDLLVTSAVEAFLQGGVFVGAVLLLFPYINDKQQGALITRIEGAAKWQPAIGALLGLTPGCGGAIFVMTLYLKGSVTFGTVAATLVSTMGDAAFVLIAGQGFGLAAGLWAAAQAGISLKLISPRRWRWVGLSLYLGMGWAATLLGWNIFAALPVEVTALVATGGLLYTVGVGFYLWERLPFHYTIWHLFVLAASLTIYAGLVVALMA